jgi:MFS family permease
MRRSALVTYFATVALTSTGYIANFTVTALAAPQLTGSRATSGLPSAAAIAGTALASVVLSTLMARRGRRSGIVAGLAVGSAGSMIGLLSILSASFALLIAGSLLIGFANSASQLTRYAAADLSPDAPGSAVGLVVWGSTVGAVIGPNLVAPAGSVAPLMGWDTLAGGLAIAMLFVLAALAVIALGPRAPVPASPLVGDSSAHKAGVLSLLGATLATRRGRTALLALGSGQFVMVLIMTMTPLHLHEAGHGLEVVGLVIGAHTLGMFGMAPMTGRLTDRLGAPAVILAGFGILATSGLLIAMTQPASGVLLSFPLFLLGAGWNFTFIAGSSLLTSSRPLAEQARLQGATDAVVWTVAAASSLVSGVALDLLGYEFMGIAGAAIALILCLLSIGTHRAQRAMPSA